jgi:hypothetical protein
VQGNYVTSGGRWGPSASGENWGSGNKSRCRHVPPSPTGLRVKLPPAFDFGVTSRRVERLWRARDSLKRCIVTRETSPAVGHVAHPSRSIVSRSLPLGSTATLAALPAMSLTPVAPFTWLRAADKGTQLGFTLVRQCYSRERSCQWTPNRAESKGAFDL